MLCKKRDPLKVRDEGTLEDYQNRAKRDADRGLDRAHEERRRPEKGALED